MPTFAVEPGNLLEITMIGGLQGQTILNTFHYVYDGADTRTDGPACVAACLTDFKQKVWAPGDGHGIKPMLSSDYGLSAIRGQVVHPVRKPYVEIGFVPEVGLIATDSCPSDVNLTISLRTLVVGRGLTGNKKFTGIPVARIAGNLWNVDAITAADALGPKFLLSLMDDVPAASWTPVVWSPRRDIDRRAVFSWQTRPEVRVLRRREFGKGV